MPPAMPLATADREWHDRPHGIVLLKDFDENGIGFLY
jgi:pyridoxine/pyridoxamine 5'-phosphate oxidase